MTCSADVCPDVESHNATVIGSFSDALSDGSLTGMEGFVGVDPVQSAIVLGLKGSNSVRNWITDAIVVPTSCGDTINIDDCKVHAGFNEAWRNIATNATALIDAALATYPDYTVVVTGHSLGAGVANVAAANLRVYYANTTTMVDLYTYGSPRTGNEAFVDFLSATTRGRAYRITHAADPFPRLPSNSWLLGSYRHVEPEYWITKANDTELATGADVSVCEGTNNDDCNSGTGGFDGAAHLEYFGGIADCAPAHITW